MKFMTRYSDARPYTTKDGSVIRELMHPQAHPGVRHQSLAEATVPAGAATRPHRHRLSEEIYHIVGGSGTMQMGEDSFPVQPGDTIVIPPGTPHRLVNGGEEPLRVLCCCCPPYTHADTELLD